MSLDAPPRNGDAGAAGPAPSPKPPASGADLKERLDQVGTILAKGLDLAEAGVSLGVTILSRVSVAAQQKIREGREAGGQPPPPGMAGGEPGEGADIAEAEQPYVLTNRLPLTPGGEVKIPFSVNNDSMTEVRKVEFMVQAFAGDSRQGAIEPDAFAVKPSRKAIAPVDFEKFVLTGALPAALPPDIYRGVVVVRSDKDLFIPVILVVTPP
jgi:hypothetical protein